MFKTHPAINREYWVSKDPEMLSMTQDNITEFEALKKLIMTRRSVRDFTKKQVSREDASDIVKTGLWAPSSRNQQAREFVVVLDPVMLRKIASVAPGFSSMPGCVIILCTDKKKAFELGGERARDRSSLIDISASAQNIFLSAWSKGIGTCPVAAFDPEAVARIVGLPEHIFPELLVTLGYTETTPEPPERPDPEEVIFFERYGKQ